MTTFNPSYITVTVPHNTPGFKIDYPPIQVYYFPHKYYDTGIEKLETKSGLIRIYNREKTICDLFRYRNKIGDDIVIESLKNYLKPKKGYKQADCICRNSECERKNTALCQSNCWLMTKKEITNIANSVKARLQNYSHKNSLEFNSVKRLLKNENNFNKTISKIEDFIEPACNEVKLTKKWNNREWQWK